MRASLHEADAGRLGASELRRERTDPVGGGGLRWYEGMEKRRLRRTLSSTLPRWWCVQHESGRQSFRARVLFARGARKG